ncbi:MAG: hypothetical protein VX766_00670 [Pseudomonadota bacterium]|nr:hypothetical protein [Pseudomonadota bacterium]
MSICHPDWRRISFTPKLDESIERARDKKPALCEWVKDPAKDRDGWLARFGKEIQGYERWPDCVEDAQQVNRAEILALDVMRRQLEW